MSWRLIVLLRNLYTISTVNTIHINLLEQPTKIKFLSGLKR